MVAFMQEGSFQILCVAARRLLQQIGRDRS
jgi:hypothetical protein